VEAPVEAPVKTAVTETPAAPAEEEEKKSGSETKPDE